MIEFIQVLTSNLMMYGPWIIYMFCVPRLLHMMQLEGYKFRDYVRWMGKNIGKVFKPGLVQLAFVGGYSIFLVVLNSILLKAAPQAFVYEVFFAEYISLLAIFAAVNIKQIVKDKKERKNAKKKLVYTSRAKRLMFWNFVLLLLVYASYMPMGIESVDPNVPGSIFLYLIVLLDFFSLMIAFLPLNMAIANFLAYPTEAALQDGYKSRARRKLKSKKFRHIIRIGVTGSYGKTSTKHILNTILSEKFNVYATPESYNTAMGNAMSIQKDLQPEHEVFISEMGARYKGDIREICDFVMPQYALITSIGPQHLETFGTVEKVAKTKAELINALPHDGVVFLPRDNEWCQQLYNAETREKYCYTLKNSNADVYARDIVLDEKGCSFTAHTKIGQIKCVTKLLGEHNVINILGCISIAVKLGLTKEEIESGVSKIEPIPHRLQILDSGNGTIVIDDAFNSNPVGAKMALDVLSKFKGRKIIITPGMVELGVQEEKENRQFGKNMARVVDIAILVGMKRSKPIVDGLRVAGFNDMNIHVVPSLDEATKKLAELTKKGDIILFENDLPDNYNE